MMLFLFIVYAGAVAGPFSSVIGWADVPCDNGIDGTLVTTTIGGEGGSVITVSSGTELNSQIQSKKKDEKPLIITIKGTLTFSSSMLNVNDCRNLTLVGEGKGAKLKGFGLYVRRTQNLIIRNIVFENCPDDALTLDYQPSHHIWIDHCSFSDLPIDSPPNEPAATSDANNDGSIDIKNAASYITISFCRFENHSKAILIGHKEGNTCDIGRLKVTLHHNRFGYISQRASRNRYGEMHLFNNYYKNTGSMLFSKVESDGTRHHGYAIASVLDANVVVENNYFENVVWPALVSRNSEKDPVWLSVYGTINGIPHWCPTSDEPPGYLSYRGENIQNPPAKTEIAISGQKQSIWPFDTSNPDTGNWNPWKSYEYSEEKIKTILHAAKDVPDFVVKAIAEGVSIAPPPHPLYLQKGTAPVEKTVIGVYDLTGKPVCRGKWNPRPGLPGGVYIFRSFGQSTAMRIVY